MLTFYKTLNGFTPKYLFDIIPAMNKSRYNIITRSNSELSQFYSRKKVLVTLSFATVLKTGISWMLKSEIYHQFPNSKKHS